MCVYVFELYNMKLVQSFSDIFQHKEYKTIACDIYGVLHDGFQAYPYTVEALKTIQQQKQDSKVILLSNSSRMYLALSKQLENKFNISTLLYNDVLSSGKLTRLFLQDCHTYLTNRMNPSSPPPMKISCHATLRDQQYPSMTAIDFCNHYLITKNKDEPIKKFFIAGDVDYLLPLYHDLNTVFQPIYDWENEEMDFVLLGSIQNLYKKEVIIDTYNEQSIQQHYMPFLNHCLKKEIPLICVNPDVLAPHGTYEDGSQRLLICPGYIGELYESMGGKVLYFGKPFKSIYDYLINQQQQEQQEQGDEKEEEKKGNKSPSILCVGDNVSTDVLGATEANLDVVFILGGVHASSLLPLLDDEQQLIDQVKELCQLENIQEPTYLMPYLKY
ncbi:unnamed protein product [Cunninghamella blakesleeana]